ncbi:MAG: outer membrane protein assembly factor BamE [Rhodobacter sp.]|nr:outer membrane protein assembly factor BamE [Paracoccaceae bacterium]MCC0075299.1 outer membrane protein assembly factor BamE [Rhodobacter sp.]
MSARGSDRGRGLGRWLVLGALALMLAACSPIMRYHGYAPTEDDLAQIQIGHDTRETVAQKIGRPGMGGVMEGSGWFYVQSDWAHRNWRAPEEVDRQVVAITFDSRDRVANIERFGLADGEVVTISRRITDAGPRPSVLSQVFRVLGQFSTATM